MVTESYGLAALKLRHSRIADNKYALEKLQEKDWPYFVRTLLELSNNEIIYGDIENVGERDVVDKTFDNIQECINMYHSVYQEVAQ